MQSKNNAIFTLDENLCLSKKFTYPKLTRSTLSKIDFKIPKKELKDLLKKINGGYGGIVYLNKKFNLMLQYHGRFN